MTAHGQQEGRDPVPTGTGGVDPARGRAEMSQPDRVFDGLRLFSADWRELMDHFADWLGVHRADAEALGDIIGSAEEGRPLSPAILGRRIGLTSGATTSLLNRLEAAGFIVRSREHVDRRIVTLRPDPVVHQQARRFFLPIVERFEGLMERHPPELLSTVETMLDDLHMTFAEVSATIHTLVPPRAELGPGPDS